MIRVIAVWVAVIALSLAGSNSQTSAQEDELARRASWERPTAAEVKQQVETWARENEGLSDLDRAKVDALWTGDCHEDLLKLLVTSLEAVDPRLQELDSRCTNLYELNALTKLLTNDTYAPLVRNNVRLYLGILLAQYEMYNESLDMLNGLAAGDVVDPGALYFFRSVCQYRLLDKKAGLESIRKLLENEDQLPRRYVAVARLMEVQLEAIENDSLKEVAHLMETVRVRLSHGQVGRRVLDEEQAIVAKLDKLIAKLERERST